MRPLFDLSTLLANARRLQAERLRKLVQSHMDAIARDVDDAVYNHIFAPNGLRLAYLHGIETIEVDVSLGAPMWFAPSGCIGAIRCPVAGVLEWRDPVDDFDRMEQATKARTRLDTRLEELIPEHRVSPSVTMPWEIDWRFVLPNLDLKGQPTYASLVAPTEPPKSWVAQERAYRKRGK